MKAKIESYRDLEAWKKSMDLVEKIYRVTKKFPADEKFGLTSQMRRAAPQYRFHRISRRDIGEVVKLSSRGLLRTHLDRAGS